MSRQRILLVKTSSLGDIIHNLPVIADIHAHIPDIAIDWVVEENFIDIPALHPGVTSVIPVALRRWRRNIASGNTWREIFACKKRLHEQRYDLVLDTQGLLKSALVASWASGSRHGYDWGSAREPLASLVYRHTHTVVRRQHAVQRNRQLAALALGYAPPDSAPNYDLHIDVKTRPELPQHYIVGLHGTSRDSKLWPVDHWIELGQHLSNHGQTLLLPWGTEKERIRAQTIADRVPLAFVLPQMRLRELAALLANATATIGVDTGLIHLAVALNVPTVAIYTDTDPALTGVLAAHPERALNLGSAGHTPSCKNVTAILDQLIQLKA